MKRKLYFKTILFSQIIMFLLTIAVEAVFGKDHDFFDNAVTSIIWAVLISVGYIEWQSDALKSMGINSFDEISMNREQQLVIAIKSQPQDVMIKIEKHATDRKFEIERSEEQITLFASQRMLMMGERIVVKRILPEDVPESLRFYRITSKQMIDSFISDYAANIRNIREISHLIKEV